MAAVCERRPTHFLVVPSGGSDALHGGGVHAAAGTTGGSWNLIGGTYYVYDGKRVIQERDTNNTPTVSYSRGNDLSGSLEGAGGIGGLLERADGYNSSTGSWTNHNYYHADGNGNITYLETSTQGLAASYRYDAYGNTLASSGTLASSNTYRFSSKEFIPTTGLYYYLYRFYDPALQRWVNRDPIQEDGGINLYLFVNNDSIDSSDFLGMKPQSFIPPVYVPGPGNPLPPTPSPKPNPPTPPNTPTVPPPSFGKGGGAGFGECPPTLGGIIEGNFPDNNSTKPPRPCSTPGAVRNSKPAGTKVIQCPNKGAVTVNCTQHESCDFYGLGASGGATYNWTSHTDCGSCP